jgi:hypothetical protein
MSTGQKVVLAQQAVDRFGLSVTLGTLGLPSSSWYYHRKHCRPYGEKYGHLKGPLEAIARTHPEYGYRRTVPELKETYGHGINHKVIQKLHRLWGLPLLRRCRPPKPSGIQQAILQVGELANLVSQLKDCNTPQKLDRGIRWMLACRNSKEERRDGKEKDA